MAYRTLEECEKDFIENLRRGGAVTVAVTKRICEDCKLCVRNYCNFYNELSYDIEDKKLAKTSYVIENGRTNDLCTHYVKDKYSFATKFMRDFIDPNYEPKEKEKE
ncbi:MAG: hypothetical protein LBV51_03500 [Acholeplasmatales bacterium]|jgi:hypothetical protein|nr:hypothetical protein [Acholeplasmatales bacterium]